MRRDPLQFAALGSNIKFSAPLGDVTLRQEILVTNFTTRSTPREPDDMAPDGSEVRLLAQLDSCGMAEFRLPAGRVSQAVEHRTVEEIWYVVSGAGEMWRSQEGREEVVRLSAGLSLTIPVGTRFQFRAIDGRTLIVIGVTIPRWPGPEEGQVREGRWSTD